MTRPRLTQTPVTKRERSATLEASGRAAKAPCQTRSRTKREGTVLKEEQVKKERKAKKGVKAEVNEEELVRRASASREGTIKGE